MNIINTISEEQYHSYDGVNYSLLSALVDGPQFYAAKKIAGESDTPAIILGSVVDMLLTDVDKFDKTVYVMTANKPGSELMQTFCEIFAETGNQESAREGSGFKIGTDAIMKKFDKEGRNYYNALIAGQGKMIIDADGLFRANAIVKELTENPFTKKYFVKEPDVDLLFQVPIEWNAQFKSLTDNKFCTMSSKSMLDVIKIDHVAKTIQPVDLKTGAEGFMKSYWRYKRYLQASMYTDAVINSTWDKINIEYSIEPLIFVYADSNLKFKPVIYKSTLKDIYVGRAGVDYIEPLLMSYTKKDNPTSEADSITWGTLGQTKRKGYQRLVAELDWHIKNDIWDYDYDTYINDGEKDINAFGVKL